MEDKKLKLNFSSNIKDDLEGNIFLSDAIFWLLSEGWPWFPELLHLLEAGFDITRLDNVCNQEWFVSEEMRVNSVSRWDDFDSFFRILETVRGRLIIRNTGAHLKYL